MEDVIMYAYVPVSIVKTATEPEKIKRGDIEINTVNTAAGRIAKVVVTGVVTDAGRKDDVAYVRINDGTGVVAAFAGKFSPYRDVIVDAVPGDIITITATPRVTENGVFLNVRAAKILRDEDAVRERAIWLRKTYAFLKQLNSDDECVKKAIEDVGKILS